MGRKRNSDGSKRRRRKTSTARDSRENALQKGFCKIHPRQRLRIADRNDDRVHRDVSFDHYCPKCFAEYTAELYEYTRRVTAFYETLRVDLTEWESMDGSYVFVEPPPEYECPDCHGDVLEGDAECPTCGIVFEKEGFDEPRKETVEPVPVVAEKVEPKVEETAEEGDDDLMDLINELEGELGL